MMETSTARATHAPPASFYMDALEKLQATGIPFLVGGALAYSHYTNIPRDTKDMDVFVKPSDCPRVLEAFAAAGYRTEMTFTHWLGKVWRDDFFLGVVFFLGDRGGGGRRGVVVDPPADPPPRLVYPPSAAGGG